MGGYAHNVRNKAKARERKEKAYIERLERVTLSEYKNLPQRDRALMVELGIKPKIMKGR